MPPLYDDIADALELVIDDDWHEITLSIVGATNEGNEGSESVTSGISPGVWTLMDLTPAGFAGLSDWTGNDNDGRTLNQHHVQVEQLATTGTWLPYLECFFVDDAAFDPNSPDFSKLYYGPWWFNLDGTIETKSDRPDNTFFGRDVGRRHFYLSARDSNWDNTKDGTVTFRYRITPANIIAEDVVNPDSSTASVVSGWVRDSQAIYSDAATDGAGWYWGADLDKPDLVDTLVVTGADLPGAGVYDGFLLYRNSVAVANDNVAFGAFRNGLMLQANNALIMQGTTSGQMLEFASTKDEGRFGDPSGVPIRGLSDVLGFRMAKYDDGDTSVAELGRIALRIQTGTVPGGDPTLLAGFELPLGVVTEPTDDTSHEATFIARGGEVESLALCELLGDLYLFWTETNGFGASFHIWGPAVAKWDGSTWTLLTDDLWGHGADITYNTSAVTRVHGSIACCSDGEFAYFMWCESDGTQTGSRRNYHWRCKKYDPGTDTFTEMGTGPSSGQGNRRFDPAGSIAAQVGSPNPYSNQTGTSEGYGTAGAGIHMEVNNGRIWVAMCEPDTGRATITTNQGRPCVWYWDTNAGSPSWVEAHPDTPTDMPASATNWWIDPVYSERQKQVGLAFCHADGPSQWPSCFFYTSFSPSPASLETYINYQEFDGSAWGNELVVHNMSEVTGAEHPDWQLPGQDVPWTHGFTVRSGIAAFTWDDSPNYIAGHDTFVNYPMWQVRVDADGNGLTQVSLPSEILPAENFGSMADVLVINGVVYLCGMDSGDFGGSIAPALVRQAEMGTGDKWHLASKSFSKHMFEGYTPPKIATDGQNIWMAATDNFDMRVWGWSPLGAPKFHVKYRTFDATQPRAAFDGPDLLMSGVEFRILDTSAGNPQFTGSDRAAVAHFRVLDVELP